MLHVFDITHRVLRYPAPVNSMRLWREWLPEDVAQKATEQEPQRFAAIVNGLESEWKHSQDPALTLKWLSLFTRSGLTLYI